MKRITLIVAVFLLGIGITACGKAQNIIKDETSEEQTTDIADKEDIGDVTITIKNE